MSKEIKILMESVQAQKYLVLNICKGLRFDCLNNVVLQISTVFQNKRLTSKYVRATPNPNFDVTFIWCTTARHINILQKWCSNIEVAICATSAGKTWTAGSAMIGIQHAQVWSRGVDLSTQRFPVYNMKTQTQTMLRPELVVTLSIRSEPPFVIDSQLAMLSDSSRPVSRGDEMFCSYTSSATTKTKKGHEEESQESLKVLARPYLYQKQQIERNRNESPKTRDCHSAPRYKVFTPDKKWTMNMQRPRQIRTPPLLPQRTFQPLPRICWRQEQKMYKIVRGVRETKDCDENSVQMTYSSTDTEQEVPKLHNYIPPLPNNMNIPSRIRLIVQNVCTSTMTSLEDSSSSSTSKTIDQPVESHDCISTLPNNMKIPSRIRLIVQNIDRSKMSSLGVYGSSSTFKMICQPVKSHDSTPTLSALLNNVEIPSRIRLMIQNVDKSKMASLGVYGSSSTFQMIGQPPPTRKHIVQMHTLYYPTPASQENMNFIKIRNVDSNVVMVTKTTETKEDDIEIQESHDQTPAPPAFAPLQTNVNIKKSVWFKVNCKEGTDLKQC